MLNLIKTIFSIVFGFGSGVVIAGAIFAFIAVIGVVPRLAQKTGTGHSVRFYEEAILLGGILGNLLYFYEHCVDNPSLLSRVSAASNMLTAVSCLLSGIFYGCVTVSLAEVLNVIPILGRRINIQRGLPLFIFILAIGKLAGSLTYFIVPGFKK